jgi:hypothetical protein
MRIDRPCSSWVGNFNSRGEVHQHEGELEATFSLVVGTFQAARA